MIDVMGQNVCQLNWGRSKITRNRQAWCWTHIMKDAKELIEYNESEGRYILGILKHVYDKAKKLLEKPPEEIRYLYGSAQPFHHYLQFFFRFVYLSCFCHILNMGCVS